MNYSLNQRFYCKRNHKLSIYNIWFHDIAKTTEMEAGLEVAYKAVCQSKEAHCTDQIIKIIQEADREFLCK